MKATCQSRISEYVDIGRGAGDDALAAYAELYGRVERRLFAEVAAGRSAGSLKSAYLPRYGMPARMFNGVRVSLEGKIASVREQQKLRADDLGRRIRRAERQIALAVERGQAGQVHQKRRRLGNLKARLAALEAADIAADRVRLALGPRGCGGSNTTWKPTATGATMSGGLPGGMPAAAGSLCSAAGMRRRVASCAWPV